MDASVFDNIVCGHLEIVFRVPIHYTIHASDVMFVFTLK